MHTVTVKGSAISSRPPHALCRNVPGGERSDHLWEDGRSPGALLPPLHCSKWWTASAPLKKGRLFVQHDKMGSRSTALKVNKELRVCYPHIQTALDCMRQSKMGSLHLSVKSYQTGFPVIQQTVQSHSCHHNIVILTSEMANRLSGILVSTSCSFCPA